MGTVDQKDAPEGYIAVRERVVGMMSTAALAVRSVMIWLNVTNNVGGVTGQTEPITST